jgi:hypothetical protein
VADPTPAYAGDLFQGGVGAVRGDLLLGHGEDPRVVAPGVRTLDRHGVISELPTGRRLLKRSAPSWSPATSTTATP